MMDALANLIILAGCFGVGLTVGACMMAVREWRGLHRAGKFRAL